MAEVTLSSLTSVLQARQYGSFAYQPAANVLIRRWWAVNIPPGMTCDSVTGLILGVPQASGVFEMVLMAEAGAGLVSMKVPIYVEAVDGTRTETTELNVDTGSGIVAGPFPVSAKEGDDLFLRIKFQRGNSSAALNLTDLKVTFKWEESTVQSGGWMKEDAADEEVYVVWVHLGQPLVGIALSDAPLGGGISAFGEISWQEHVSWGLGKTLLHHASQTFPVRLDRRIASTL